MQPPPALPVVVPDALDRRRRDRLGRSLRSGSLFLGTLAVLSALDLGPGDRLPLLGAALLAGAGALSGTLLSRRAAAGEAPEARLVRGLRRGRLVPQADVVTGPDPDDALVDALYAEGTPPAGLLRDGLRAEELLPVELGDFLVESRLEEGRPEGTRHLEDPAEVDVAGLDEAGLDALLRELDDASLHAHVAALLDRWAAAHPLPPAAPSALAELRAPDEVEEEAAARLSSRLLPVRAGGLLLAVALALLGAGGALAVRAVQERDLAGRPGAHDVVLGEPGVLVGVAYDDRDYSDAVLTDPTGSYTARGTEDEELAQGQRWTLVPRERGALSGVALRDTGGLPSAALQAGAGLLAGLLALGLAALLARTRPVAPLAGLRPRSAEPARWHLGPGLEHLVLVEQAPPVARVPGVLAEPPSRARPGAAVTLPVLALAGAVALGAVLSPGALGPEDPSVALPAVVPAGFAEDVGVTVQEADELSRTVDTDTFGTPTDREATAYLRRPELPFDASEAEQRAFERLARCTVRLARFAEPVDPEAALRRYVEQQRSTDELYADDPALQVRPSRTVPVRAPWTGRTSARVRSPRGNFGGETEAVLVRRDSVARLQCSGPAGGAAVTDAAVAVAEQALATTARALPEDEVARLAERLLAAPATG